MYLGKGEIKVRVDSIRIQIVYKKKKNVQGRKYATETITVTNKEAY